MVTILSVSGNAAVCDTKTGSCVAATPGLKLGENSVWIVSTAKGSSVHMNVNGSPFDLGPQSQLRLDTSENGILDWINHKRPFSRHTRDWAGSLKLLLGFSWSKVGGTGAEKRAWEREQKQPNAAPGVRG